LFSRCLPSSTSSEYCSYFCSISCFIYVNRSLSACSFDSSCVISPLSFASTELEICELAGVSLSLCLPSLSCLSASSLFFTLSTLIFLASRSSALPLGGRPLYLLPLKSDESALSMIFEVDDSELTFSLLSSSLNLYTCTFLGSAMNLSYLYRYPTSRFCSLIRLISELHRSRVLSLELTTVTRFLILSLCG